MKTGGILIAILGAALFAWHLVRVQINPDYEGYASHQVMAMNSLIVFVFGITLCFIGRWQKNRKEKVRIQKYERRG